MNPKKILDKVLHGNRNLRFGDAQTLAEAVGFQLSRIKGSHHIFTHPEIPEILNLQEVHGQAKPYQVRQLLELIERYNLQVRL